MPPDDHSATGPPSPVPRALLERLIFGEQRGRDFTQYSPILPDVWLASGGSPERHRLSVSCTSAT
jgi:hypothetical protein